MRKKLLIVILMLVCFWHFNVYAFEPNGEGLSDPMVGELEGGSSSDENEEDKDKPSSSEQDQKPSETENVFQEEKSESESSSANDETKKSEEKNIESKSGNDGTGQSDSNPSLTNPSGSADQNETTDNFDSNTQGNEAAGNVGEIDPSNSSDELGNQKREIPEATNGEGNIMLGATPTDADSNTETESTREITTYEYAMAKDDEMTVDALLNELAITLPEGVTVTSVTSSNASIVKVENGLIKCLSVIDSSNPPTLTISLSDETTYTVTIKKAPNHSKELIDNGDGTYDIELTVTGETEEVVTKANVIIVMDTSNSMIQNNTSVREEYTYDADTYDSSREYYSAQTGGRRVYYRNGSWRTSNNDNGTVHTGTVWLRLNRLEAEQGALCDLVDNLLANNEPDSDNKKDIIEISLVRYNIDATTVLSNSYNPTDIKNAVNDPSHHEGTNWEMGLRAAQTEAATLREEEKNEDVYIIFLTDGQPTAKEGSTTYGTDYYVFWKAASDEAREIASTVGYHLYTIFTYGDTNEYINFLDNLTYFAYSTDDYTDGYNNRQEVGTAHTENGEVKRHDNFYNATNTTELVEAFNKIAQDINTSGIGTVSMIDGTTDKVTTSSGVSHLLDIEKDADGNAIFKYYQVKNGVEEEWNITDKDLKATLNSDGEVVWNLSKLGLLENGVTYKVRFTVWPSQETLDLIADLKNNPDMYDGLDPEIKKYLIRNGTGATATYTLKTNTNATLSFTDNRPNGTDNGNASFVNPTPVTTSATELLSITKKWYGDDERTLDLYVTCDGEPWYKVPLSSGTDTMTGSAYIAVGTISEATDGSYVVHTPGHEYQFAELGPDAYHWEIKDNKIIRPMLINKVVTMLIRNDNPAEGEKYYEIEDKNGVKHKYVVASTGLTQVELLAENYRRANVDIKKEVLGNYNPEGYNFEFTIQASSPKTTDPHDNYIWFTVYKETVDDNGNSSFDKLANSIVIGALTTYYGTGENQVHAEVDETTGVATGTFYVKSGVEFKILMQDNWSLRIKNLLTGSTYKVSESTGSEYELVSVNGNTTVTNVDSKVTTIGETPSYTFENRFKVKNITVTKAWAGLESQDNPTRPTVTIELLVDGTNTAIDSQVLTEDDDWTYTWTDLPAMNGTTEIIYVVREVTGGSIVTEAAPGKYTYTLSGNETNGYTVTNTYTPLVTSVTVTKAWAGLESQDNPTRPTVTIELLKEGNNTPIETKVLNEGNNWTWTWTNLPANAAGVDINYIVREVTGDAIVTQDTPGKYTYTLAGTEAGGYTVTNTYTPLVTSVTVTKAWDGPESQDNATRPTVTIELLVEGSDEVIDTKVLTEDDDWTYTWTGLAANNAGSDINYVVREVTGGSIVTQDAPGKYTYTLSGNETNGYTVTNTYTPLVTSVTVTKAWAGLESQDNATRPTVTIELLVEGSDEVIDTKVLTEDDDWTYTWTGLAANNAGSDINYVVREVTGDAIVTEDTPGKYTYTLSGTEAGGYTVTNTYTPLVTSVTVTKAWDGPESQDNATRPTVTIELLVEGSDEVIDTKVLTEDDDWTYTWTGLAANNAGSDINYVVREVTGGSIVTQDAPGKYTYTLSGTEAGGYTVTNTYTPLVTSVTVTKAWDGPESQDNATRPTVTIELLVEESDEVIDTKVLTEDDDWTYTWTGLAANNAGSDINYVVREVTGEAIVTEDTPGKYTYTLSGTEAGGYTVTNTYTPLVTSVTVTKAWDGLESQDNPTRPTVQVQLFKDGTEEAIDTVTLNEDNDWTKEWTLPANENGTPIVYTVAEVTGDMIVEEDAPGKYTYTLSGTQADGYIVTNTYVPVVIDIEVKKIWDDSDNLEGFRPDSVTFQLMANGEEFGDPVTVTFKEDKSENEWTYTFEGLDKYADGEEITYTVVEVTTPDHYEKTEDGLTVTNSREVEYTSATVKKVWDDANNQDGVRPDSITVTLSDGTKVTLNEENKWTATVDKLIKYADGKEIKYTWTEADVEGYELTNTEVDGTITTFTNTHEPATTIVIVEKVWADDENESNKRPESVTVVLLANTKETDKEVVLSEENGWRYVFEDLQAYDDGEEIEYTVLEKEVPEDYEASYEYTEEEGNLKIIVHNVLGKGGDNPPPHNNPQTGDNIMLYLITLLLGVIGLIGGKVYLKENN